MAGHKGHAPGESSRKFKIFGTDGTSRKTNAQRSTQNQINSDLRTLRCRGCGARRDKGSGPICPNCSATIHDRD